MQIAGAVIDDGNAHRDGPGSGNSPMILVSRQRRRPRESLAGNIPRRRRRAAIDRGLIVDDALPRGPAIEEAPFGRLLDCGPPRCRAGASCAATGSSAACSTLQIPSAARSTRTPKDRCRRRQVLAIPTSIASATTIQPISASHSRCQTSQSGPKTAAQKSNPSRTNANLSIAAIPATVRRPEHELCRPAS